MFSLPLWLVVLGIGAFFKWVEPTLKKWLLK